MADGSHIEWTDATWSPITGCSVVSPGCTNCYAMRLAGTRLRDHPSRAGLTTPSRAGPVWNGQVRLNEDWLTQPLRWRRPRRIFVCAHGDLFHEDVPDAWIDQVFAVMALAPQHQFQVLTKRPARMRRWFERCGPVYAEACDFIVLPMRELQGIPRGANVISRFRWPLPNVWLGVSAEDQERADERLPDLITSPAAVRFVSVEPLLGPIDLSWALSRPIEIGAGFLRRGRFSPGLETLRHLDWVIVGGESGPGARPMHPDWARRIRDDCAVAGVPFFFKQWGESAPAPSLPRPFRARGFTQWLPGSPVGDEAIVYQVGKRAAGRLLDGALHNAMPEVA